MTFSGHVWPTLSKCQFSRTDPFLTPFQLPLAARFSDRLYDFRAVAQHVLHPCELERFAIHVFFISRQRLPLVRRDQLAQLLRFGSRQFALLKTFGLAFRPLDDRSI